ncbi:MAG: FxsA family protein [Magnetococcales bacterium]|nr:FxsA family protein [Magnetococcales bacterium]
MKQLPIILLAIIPFIEIWLMIWIGHLSGAGVVLLSWLVAGMIGWSVLRQAGAGTLVTAHNRIRNGENPGPELLDGALRMLGAVLLIIPGYLSDLSGVLLLVPWIRTWLKLRILAHFASVAASADGVIEGEVVNHEE